MSFIPDFSILLPFTLATLVVSITPGPDMTLFLGRTIQQGRAAGFATMFGAMSGLMIHTLLVAFGISALLAASQTAFTLLKICGAGYLLWLAYQAIRNGGNFQIEERQQKRTSFIGNFTVGLATNLLNPKIVLFFITFLPQFVSSTDPNAIGKLVFLGFWFILIGGIICFTIIAMADKFVRKLTANPGMARFMDYAFATIFGAFALKILGTQRL